MDLISGQKEDNFIISMAAGKVTAVGYDSRSGYYIFIQHANGYETFYCHLLKGSITVKKSQVVGKGQVIATMGSSGSSTGVHLHLGVKNTKKVWVDPKPYLEGTKTFDANPKKHYEGTYPTLPTRGYFKTSDRGVNVARLQELLNWTNNGNNRPDGVLGPKTIVAVKLFQKQNGLTVDGKFGKKCLAKAKTITK